MRDDGGCEEGDTEEKGVYGRYHVEGRDWNWRRMTSGRRWEGKPQFTKNFGRNSGREAPFSLVVESRRHLSTATGRYALSLEAYTRRPQN